MAPALDVAFGLVFLYLSLALMATAVNEWIAAALKLRARMLREGVAHLLDGTADPAAPLAKQFYAHPLIAALSRRGRPPSYIPPATFALVVKDLASKRQQLDSESSSTPADDGHLREQFRTLALGRSATDTRSQADVLEAWFNDGMERVSGWYKRRIQLVTLLVAIGLTVLTNADTFRAASILWTNPTARATVVEQARVRAATAVATPPIQAGYSDLNKPAPEGLSRRSAELQGVPSAGADVPDLELPAADRRALGLFIGWSGVFREFNDHWCASKQQAVNAACSLDGPEHERRCRMLIDDLAADRRCNATGETNLGTGAFPGAALVTKPGVLVGQVTRHAGGWLLTILAISLGAPFWFDLLGRFVNVRSSGAKPGVQK